MPSLRIPYALEFNALIGSTNGIKQYAFTGMELDAELVVEYEDSQNWEITGLRFEQSRWNPEFEVTPTSDPDLWKLIERAIDLDDKAIAARVVEAGEEELASIAADRGDYEYEMRRERMWEAGR